MKAGIVGAGILGRLLALKLVQAGWQVTLFDRDTSDGKLSCSMAGAGQLSPMAELETAEQAIYELGENSVDKWSEIIASLDKSTNSGVLPLQNIFFQQKGSLLIAHPQDEAELDHRYSLLKKKLSPKLVTDNLLQRLNKNQIEHLEPELKKFNQALYFPQEGQILNTDIMKALYEKLLNENVSCKMETPVDKIKSRQVIAKNKIYNFDWVFDCRGLGAKKNFSELRGVRGELLILQAKEVNITRPIRLVHPRYRLYIAPKKHPIYFIGATEIESEDDSPISVRSALELLSAAYSVHSGFAEARILKTVVGCRPAFPDHLPKIQYEDGLIRINGLYRHGFLLAPSLVDQVMSYLNM